MKTQRTALLVSGLSLAALLPGFTSAVIGQEQKAIVIENAIFELIETVDVPVEVTGILGEANVSEGVVVRQGDPLMSVDDREARNRYRASEIAIRQAQLEAADRSDLEFSIKAKAVAEAELNRATQANNDLENTYSEFEMERLRLLVDKSSAEIEKAEQRRRLKELELDSRTNELELAAILIEKHRVVAPLDGMIVSVEKRSGEWVKAGDTLVTIVRIDKLRVEGLVSADAAALLLADEPVSLEVALPSLQGKRFPGRLVFVSPEANPVSGQVRIYAEVDNREGKLRPGLRGRLTIQTTVDSDNGR